MPPFSRFKHNKPVDTYFSFCPLTKKSMFLVTIRPLNPVGVRGNVESTNLEILNVESWNVEC